MTDIREMCNLSDEEFSERSKRLREGLLSKIETRTRLADGIALSFAASPQMRAELEEFVAFERQCCSGIDWAVHDIAGALQLEIRGLESNSDIFAGLGMDRGSKPDLQIASPVERGPSEDGPGWKTYLGSLGLGGILSLAICCVLPIGVAMVVGAGVAAPLVALDNPWIITGVGFSTAGFLIYRARRRSAAQATSASATSQGCGC